MIGRFHPVLLTALRLVLGAIFLWAGLAKIFEPVDFAKTVHAYSMLPDVLVVPFAIAIPWIECVTGFCLIVGLWTRSNALVALLLLVCFSVALGVNIYRGVDMSCGCFGIGADGVSLSVALLADVFLLFIAGFLISSRPVSFSVDGLLDRVVILQTE